MINFYFWFVFMDFIIRLLDSSLSPLATNCSRRSHPSIPPPPDNPAALGEYARSPIRARRLSQPYASSIPPVSALGIRAALAAPVEGGSSWTIIRPPSRSAMCSARSRAAFRSAWARCSRAIVADIRHARHVAMYLSRALAGGGIDGRRPYAASFPRIAMAFARDHTSVIHACNAIARRREADADFSRLVDRIARELAAAAFKPAQAA